ncbi:MAG: Cytochrome C biogenesis protein transmembrane region [Syntrophorhabdus sp. PtaU1.Bin153]|nr:MAG: Cytochrome C biogenesis protein transmembrane region [Syntrophorhabdus sp. PtaU1.Bin153]
MILDFVWAFVTGFAGSVHCLGMCGPLVIAYSLHFLPKERAGTLPLLAVSREGATHHAAFHTGRIATYGLIGALAAGFIHLGGFNEWLLRSRSIATLVGGLLMIFFGLALLKIFPLPFTDISASKPANPYFSRFVRACLNSRGPASKCLLGLAAGFLPCMLSWAMVVRAATTGNMVQGFTLMVLFGLGTTPVLLFTGFFASLLTERMRLAGQHIASVSVIVMGLMLLLKGVMRLV